jgi:hypothetical protein
MEKTSVTASCQACAYWKNTESMSGECHRHAPQAIVFNVENGLKFESHFPLTAAEDWCGDFAQK